MSVQEKPKRPPSVWVAQILLSLIALAFLLFPLVMVLSVPANLTFLISILLMMFVFVVLPTASVVAIGFRRNFGRWLAVGIFSFILLMLIISQFVQPSGPVQRWEYSNDVQRTSAFVTGLLFYGSVLFLIFRLAFSKRVSQFFTSGINIAEDQPDSPTP